MLLRLLYYFFKVLCPILVHSYYRITFLRKENFKLPKGACIMTSNHPNTLIDVLMTVPFVNRRSHFLANAGLFKKPFFNWMWRTLWCIPIKRRQDNVTHIDNEDSFAACDTFLTGGGMLFIAPEGSSHNERHVRAFKPGTARIAFSAEAKNNFQLGLHICCFGVTYEKPWRFRSNAYVLGANPIRVADFKEAYLKEPEAAINELTELIENQTRSVVVDAADLSQDQLLAKLESLQDTDLLRTNIDLSTKQRFERAQQWAGQLKTLSLDNKPKFEAMQQSLSAYFEQLDKFKLTDKAVGVAQNPWTSIFYFILFLPLFLLGAMMNLLPYGLTELLWQKLKLEGYEATVRIVAGGLIILPICYNIEIYLAKIYVHFPFFSLVFWLMGIFSGIFAWNYWQVVKAWVTQIRFDKLGKEKGRLKESRAEAVLAASTSSFLSNQLLEKGER